MFAHYSLSPTAVKVFQKVKNNIANAVIVAIDPAILLVMETGACDSAIAASLTQNGRPVAFLTRTLSCSEH